MSKLKELEAKIKSEGLLGVSGAVFTDYTKPDGSIRKANTTVEDFCIAEARYADVSCEAYASELLALITSEGERIIGECPKCFKFLTEAESFTHECNGLGSVNIEDLFDKVVDS